MKTYQNINSRTREFIAQQLRLLLGRGFGINQGAQDSRLNRVEIHGSNLIIYYDNGCDLTLQPDDEIELMPDRITIRGSHVLTLEPVWNLQKTADIPGLNHLNLIDELDETAFRCFCLFTLQGFIIPSFPKAKCETVNLHPNNDIQLTVTIPERIEFINPNPPVRAGDAITPHISAPIPNKIPAKRLGYQLSVEDVIHYAMRDFKEETPLEVEVRMFELKKYTDPFSERLAAEIKALIAHTASQMVFALTN